MLCMNLHRSKPLVIAVVPLDEIAVHFGSAAKAGQFACSTRALHWAFENPSEIQPCQPFPKPHGVLFPAFSQRQVGQTGMLSGETPGCFTVSREIDHGERIIHGVIHKTLAWKFSPCHR